MLRLRLTTLTGLRRVVQALHGVRRNVGPILGIVLLGRGRTQILRARIVRLGRVLEILLRLSFGC